jgi:hypothetical protein
MAFKGHRHITKPDGSTEAGWATYVCGHCNTKVTGAVVATYSWQNTQGITILNKWLLCPNCSLGSVIINDRVFPGSPFGPKIQGLPADVEDAYEEARRCMEVSAYTAAELICRKILMHVAVEKGASEGESFVSYLSYLENNGYVTPPMKTWVDLIRQHGNRATHKLETPEKERAQSTVMFTAELLRLIYEMEYLAKQYTNSE